MTPPIPRISTLVSELDLLDGSLDDKFFIIPLHEPLTTTGHCEISDSLKASNQQQTHFRRGDGASFPLDCAALAEKLNTLLQIAKKNPATRYLHSGNQGMPPSVDEIYGSYLTLAMMFQLIWGIQKPDTALSAIFKSQDFPAASQAVQDLGKDWPNPAYRQVKIISVLGAYQVFERLGKKYNFDPKTLKQ